MLEFGMSKDQAIAAPFFSEEDIDEHLKLLGCKNEILRKKWESTIYIHSSGGHPQLVNAIIVKAKASGFPEIELNDLLLQPKEVKDEQERARMIVSKLNDSTKNLLYRLSLVTKTLTRLQILNISTVGDPIKEPGNALDQIIGPWLEEIGQDLYRVSPLIRNIGQEVNGNDWFQKAHLNIAWALIKGKKITAYDISHIICHSIIGKSTAPLIILIQGLITADEAVWKQIAEHDVLLSLVAQEPKKAAENFGKKDDMFPLFPLRLLQYKIADAKKDGEQALKILQYFNEEFPESSAEEPILLARHMFLSTILMSSSNCLPYDFV